MNFYLQDLAIAANGTFSEKQRDESPHEYIFSIDTRTLLPGQIFLALHGEQSDGHDYLEQAVKKNAGGLIVSNREKGRQLEHMLSSEGTPRSRRPFVLYVDDTLAALQSIARTCRRNHPIPLLAVTGSNGKTTVKDMSASILALRHGEQVLKSEKSFNNHIGLPMTLANMAQQHSVAVVEIGMNAPGEIRHLAGIAGPDIGTVTNIAQAHAGFFDSLSAIMQAKMELLETLPQHGTAILNEDDALIENMRAYVRDGMNAVSFGIRQAAPIPQRRVHITAEEIQAAANGAFAFRLLTPAGAIRVELQIPGYHNISNALAATANVFALYELLRCDVSLEEIKRGLEEFQPSPMRMQVIRRQNITVINDAYNANPTSMASALDTLNTMMCQGRKTAALGDMFELGELSQSAHYAVGKHAAQIALQRLYLLGQYAQDVARGARDAGMAAERITIGESHRQLAHVIASQVQDGDVLLCKASRGMTMEHVIHEVFNELDLRAL